MPTLFDPIRIGAIDAPNRILMAPLTRARATAEHVPTPIMAEYYTQRASAGLIISEATGISRQGLGWPYAPGLWTGEQVRAWRPVTDAVHRAGGRIVAQLWHMGRIVHPSFLGGDKPVSASATTAPGQAHTYAGKQDYAEARPLGLDEIPGLLDDYRQATRNALEAGFDGVQVHAANGYLIDQFLRDNSNHRDRRLWRVGRQPGAAAGGGDGSGGGDRRRGPHRGAAVAQRRDPGRQRQRAGGTVRRRRGRIVVDRHRLPGAARARRQRHLRQPRPSGDRADDPRRRSPAPWC